MIHTPLEIEKLFKLNYSQQGDILQTTKLQFDFHVNNQLYLIQTSISKYILKINESLDDFYGISNSYRKLETISKVGSLLAKNGCNVETTVKSDKGEYVTRFEENSIRVFNFIDGRSFSEENSQDLIRLIKFSYKLHNYPVVSLQSISNVESDLVAPYPLEEIILEREFIKDRLKQHQQNIYYDILYHFDEISKDAFKLLKWKQKNNNSLTHMDLHPRNSIIRTEEFYAIDLDFLRIGNPYICLGLSLTRTSFFKKSKKHTDLIEKNLTIFDINYPNGDSKEFKKNILFGALYIEIEKIFRNLYRYFDTGKYENYAEDVGKFHYRYYTMIKNLIEKIGS